MFDFLRSRFASSPPASSTRPSSSASGCSASSVPPVSPPQPSGGETGSTRKASFSPSFFLPSQRKKECSHTEKKENNVVFTRASTENTSKIVSENLLSSSPSESHHHTSQLQQFHPHALARDLNSNTFLPVSGLVDLPPYTVSSSSFRGPSSQDHSPSIPASLKHQQPQESLPQEGDIKAHRQLLHRLHLQNQDLLRQELAAAKSAQGPVSSAGGNSGGPHVNLCSQETSGLYSHLGSAKVTTAGLCTQQSQLNKSSSSPSPSISSPALHLPEPYRVLSGHSSLEHSGHHLPIDLSRVHQSLSPPRLLPSPSRTTGCFPRGGPIVACGGGGQSASQPLSSSTTSLRAPLQLSHPVCSSSFSSSLASSSHSIRGGAGEGRRSASAHSELRSLVSLWKDDTKPDAVNTLSHPSFSLQEPSRPEGLSPPRRSRSSGTTFSASEGGGPNSHSSRHLARGHPPVSLSGREINSCNNSNSVHDNKITTDGDLRESLYDSQQRSEGGGGSRVVRSNSQAVVSRRNSNTSSHLSYSLSETGLQAASVSSVYVHPSLSRCSPEVYVVASVLSPAASSFSSSNVNKGRQGGRVEPARSSPVPPVVHLGSKSLPHQDISSVQFTSDTLQRQQAAHSSELNAVFNTHASSPFLQPLLHPSQATGQLIGLSSSSSQVISASNSQIEFVSPSPPEGFPPPVGTSFSLSSLSGVCAVPSGRAEANNVIYSKQVSQQIAASSSGVHEAPPRYSRRSSTDTTTTLTRTFLGGDTKGTTDSNTIEEKDAYRKVDEGHLDLIRSSSRVDHSQSTLSEAPINSSGSLPLTAPATPAGSSSSSSSSCAVFHAPEEAPFRSHDDHVGKALSLSQLDSKASRVFIAENSVPLGPDKLYLSRDQDNRIKTRPVELLGGYGEIDHTICRRGQHANTEELRKSSLRVSSLPSLESTRPSPVLPSPQHLWRPSPPSLSSSSSSGFSASRGASLQQPRVLAPSSGVQTPGQEEVPTTELPTIGSIHQQTTSASSQFRLPHGEETPSSTVGTRERTREERDKANPVRETGHVPEPFHPSNSSMQTTAYEHSNAILQQGLHEPLDTERLETSISLHLRQSLSTLSESQGPSLASKDTSHGQESGGNQHLSPEVKASGNDTPLLYWPESTLRATLDPTTVISPQLPPSQAGCLSQVFSSGVHRTLLHTSEPAGTTSKKAASSHQKSSSEVFPTSLLGKPNLALSRLPLRIPGETEKKIEGGKNTAGELTQVATPLRPSRAPVPVESVQAGGSSSRRRRSSISGATAAKQDLKEDSERGHRYEGEKVSSFSSSYTSKDVYPTGKKKPAVSSSFSSSCLEKSLSSESIEATPEDKERKASVSSSSSLSRPRASSVAGRTRAVAQAAFHRAASVARVSLQKVLSPRLSLQPSTSSRSSSIDKKSLEKAKKPQKQLDKKLKSSDHQPSSKANTLVVLTAKQQASDISLLKVKSEPPSKNDRPIRDINKPGAIQQRKQRLVGSVEEGVSCQRKESGVAVSSVDRSGASKESETPGNSKGVSVDRKIEVGESGTIASEESGKKGKENRKDTRGIIQASTDSKALVPRSKTRSTSQDRGVQTPGVLCPLRLSERKERKAQENEAHAESDRALLLERTSPGVNEDTSAVKKGLDPRKTRRNPDTEEISQTTSQLDQVPIKNDENVGSIPPSEHLTRAPVGKISLHLQTNTEERRSSIHSLTGKASRGRLHSSHVKTREEEGSSVHSLKEGDSRAYIKKLPGAPLNERKQEDDRLKFEKTPSLPVSEAIAIKGERVIKDLRQDVLEDSICQPSQIVLREKNGGEKKEKSQTLEQGDERLAEKKELRSKTSSFAGDGNTEGRDVPTETSSGSLVSTFTSLSKNKTGESHKREGMKCGTISIFTEDKEEKRTSLELGSLRSTVVSPLQESKPPPSQIPLSTPLIKNYTINPSSTNPFEPPHVSRKSPRSCSPRHSTSLLWHAHNCLESEAVCTPEEEGHRILEERPIIQSQIPEVLEPTAECTEERILHQEEDKKEEIKEASVYVYRPQRERESVLPLNEKEIAKEQEKEEEGQHGQEEIFEPPLSLEFLDTNPELLLLSLVNDIQREEPTRIEPRSISQLGESVSFEANTSSPDCPDHSIDVSLTDHLGVYEDIAQDKEKNEKEKKKGDLFPMQRSSSLPSSMLPRIDREKSLNKDPSFPGESRRLRRNTIDGGDLLGEIKQKKPSVEEEDSNDLSVPCNRHRASSSFSSSSSPQDLLELNKGEERKPEHLLPSSLSVVLSLSSSSSSSLRQGAKSSEETMISTTGKTPLTSSSSSGSSSSSEKTSDAKEVRISRHKTPEEMREGTSLSKEEVSISKATTRSAVLLHSLPKERGTEEKEDHLNVHEDQTGPASRQKEKAPKKTEIFQRNVPCFHDTAMRQKDESASVDSSSTVKTEEEAEACPLQDSLGEKKEEVYKEDSETSHERMNHQRRKEKKTGENEAGGARKVSRSENDGLKEREEQKKTGEERKKSLVDEEGSDCRDKTDLLQKKEDQREQLSTMMLNESLLETEGSFRSSFSPLFAGDLSMPLSPSEPPASPPPLSSSLLLLHPSAAPPSLPLSSSSSSASHQQPSSSSSSAHPSAQQTLSPRHLSPSSPPPPPCPPPPSSNFSLLPHPSSATSLPEGVATLGLSMEEALSHREIELEEGFSLPFYPPVAPSPSSPSSPPQSPCLSPGDLSLKENTCQVADKTSLSAQKTAKRSSMKTGSSSLNVRERDEIKGYGAEDKKTTKNGREKMKEKEEEKTNTKKEKEGQHAPTRNLMYDGSSEEVSGDFLLVSSSFSASASPDTLIHEKEAEKKERKEYQDMDYASPLSEDRSLPETQICPKKKTTTESLFLSRSHKSMKISSSSFSSSSSTSLPPVPSQRRSLSLSALPSAAISLEDEENEEEPAAGLLYESAGEDRDLRVSRVSKKCLKGSSKKEGVKALRRSESKEIWSSLSSSSQANLKEEKKIKSWPLPPGPLSLPVKPAASVAFLSEQRVPSAMRKQEEETGKEEKEREEKEDEEKKRKNLFSDLEKRDISMAGDMPTRSLVLTTTPTTTTTTAAGQDDEEMLVFQTKTRKVKGKEEDPGSIPFLAEEDFMRDHRSPLLSDSYPMRKETGKRKNERTMEKRRFIEDDLEKNSLLTLKEDIHEEKKIEKKKSFLQGHEEKEREEKTEEKKIPHNTLSSFSSFKMVSSDENIDRDDKPQPSSSSSSIIFCLEALDGGNIGSSLDVAHGTPERRNGSTSVSSSSSSLLSSSSSSSPPVSVHKEKDLTTLPHHSSEFLHAHSHASEEERKEERDSSSSSTLVPTVIEERKRDHPSEMKEKSSSVVSLSNPVSSSLLSPGSSFDVEEEEELKKKKRSSFSSLNEETEDSPSHVESFHLLLSLQKAQEDTLHGVEEEEKKNLAISDSQLSSSIISSSEQNISLDLQDHGRSERSPHSFSTPDQIGTSLSSIMKSRSDLSKHDLLPFKERREFSSPPPPCPSHTIPLPQIFRLDEEDSSHERNLVKSSSSSCLSLEIQRDQRDDEEREREEEIEGLDMKTKMNLHGESLPPGHVSKEKTREEKKHLENRGVDSSSAQDLELILPPPCSPSSSSSSSFPSSPSSLDEKSSSSSLPLRLPRDLFLYPLDRDLHEDPSKHSTSVTSTCCSRLSGDEDDEAFEGDLRRIWRNRPELLLRIRIWREKYKRLKKADGMKDKLLEEQRSHLQLSEKKFENVLHESNLMIQAERSRNEDLMKEIENLTDQFLVWKEEKEREVASSQKEYIQELHEARQHAKALAETCETQRMKAEERIEEQKNMHERKVQELKDLLDLSTKERKMIEETFKVRMEKEKELAEKKINELKRQLEKKTEDASQAQEKLLALQSLHERYEKDLEKMKNLLEKEKEISKKEKDELKELLMKEKDEKVKELHTIKEETIEMYEKRYEELFSQLHAQEKQLEEQQKLLGEQETLLFRQQKELQSLQAKEEEEETRRRKERMKGQLTEDHRGERCCPPPSLPSPKEEEKKKEEDARNFIRLPQSEKKEETCEKDCREEDTKIDSQLGEKEKPSRCSMKTTEEGEGKKEALKEKKKGTEKDDIRKNLSVGRSIDDVEESDELSRRIQREYEEENKRLYIENKKYLEEIRRFKNTEDELAKQIQVLKGQKEELQQVTQAAERRTVEIFLSHQEQQKLLHAARVGRRRRERRSEKGEEEQHKERDGGISLSSSPPSEELKLYQRRFAEVKEEKTILNESVKESETEERQESHANRVAK
ncbi:hypothetical protein CSUI_005046, partial [Cystoisospora suis]